MFELKSSGSLKGAEDTLKRLSRINLASILSRHGRAGVAALSAATPVDSGGTAASWNFEIKQSSSGIELVWINTNVVSGQPLVLMLQYGHGTGTGGYVAGYDFINPAIRPIFDRIAQDVRKAVTG